MALTAAAQGRMVRGNREGIIFMRLAGFGVAALLAVSCSGSGVNGANGTGGGGAGGGCPVGSKCGIAGALSGGGAGGAGAGGHNAGGAGGDDASAASAGDSGAAGEAGAGGDGLSGQLGNVVSDAGDQVVVTGEPKMVKFTATSRDGKPIGGAWTTDDTRIGTIDAGGVFTANGFVAGIVVVSLQVGTALLKTKLTVAVDIIDNSGALSALDQAALAAGGPVDPNFKFLYPYQNTLFPRGLSAPELQFGDGKSVVGAATNQIYVKLTTTRFSYRTYQQAGPRVHAVISQAAWNGMTLSAGASDDVQVAVNKRAGATVAGPVTETWRIAQGSLKGLIYYSTYVSPLLPGGGILSVRPNKPAQVVRAGCVVCHSVSANGSVLSAALGPDLTLPTSSSAYQLAPGTVTALGSAPSDGAQYSMAALSPDGSRAVSNGVPPAAFPPQLPHGLHIDTGTAGKSTLVDTATGAKLASASLNANIAYAQTPAFSPDGKKLAFVNGDKWPLRQLCTLDVDSTYTFSGLKTIVSNTSELTSAFGSSQPQDLAWPSFTPDSAALVYQQGDSFDSSAFNFADASGQAGAQHAEVRLAELDGTVKKLNALNGRDAGGVSYLPYGEAVENNLDYDPSVSPVAAGGYFWVVFTSRRAYGNALAPGRAATTLVGDDPTQDPWGSQRGPSPRKKLWVAAIDVNHAGKADPSHPAFYLTGQELESANQNGRPTLAACLPDTSACETATDCCNGYCRAASPGASGVPVLKCVPPPINSCSTPDEPCLTAIDCCDPNNLCLSGRCAEQTPKP
jgi:hypothetical protein